VALLEASPNRTADLHKLPDQVDIDALMRQALAEQQAGGEIDAAVALVVERMYPHAREGLCRLITQQIDAIQQLQGTSRQEAAEQVAKGESELVMRPEGIPELRTKFVSNVRVSGLENLSPEQREEVQKQIAVAMESGRPPDLMRIAVPPAKGKAGCGSMVVAGAVVVLLGWAISHV
jgi:hypothetical protein